MQIPKIKYKDFLISQEKLPIRDSKEYVPFWLKHINYCKSGVEVGGVYISGWLYWHLNFYRATVDVRDEWGNKSRAISNMSLRDNEWLINWAFEKARKEDNKPVMFFGTRRFGKTAFIASRIAYDTFIFQNSNPLIIGASSVDLNNITKYFDENHEKRHDCFSDFLKIGDWNKSTSSDLKIEFNKRMVTKGRNPINPISYQFFDIASKPNDSSFSFSKVSVRNLEHGKVATKEELLAGITPTSAVTDECGKINYSKQRAALLPALIDDLGERRFVEFMMGTGGEIANSSDAEKDFLYTDKSGFLHCDLKEYAKTIREPHFKYVQQSDKKTSLFVPAQMSNSGGAKLEIPLYEYLNQDFTEEQKKDLEGLNIKVTQWDIAEQNVRKKIKAEQEKSITEGKKAQMYYPFQPEDCFLASDTNIFNVELIKRKIKQIEDEKAYGEYVVLREDSKGNVLFEPTKKEPVREYPYKGGVQDAPAIIYERPLSREPQSIRRGTYCAGFDGYKIASSETTDSLGSFTIFKRVGGVNGIGRVIVATLATRPSNESQYFYQCLLLLKAYNAEVLPESDLGFHNYMKREKKAHQYWAECKNLAQGINPNTRANFSIGLPATSNNKEFYLKLMEAYCDEDVTLGVDEDGMEIIEKGIMRIPDIMLLKEMENFGKYKNYDRIISFGHALAWDSELSKHNIFGSDGEFKPRDFNHKSLIEKIKAKQRY